MLPVGSNDVGRVSASTRVIAVSVPNVNTAASAWGSYRTSVNAIEAATGYDLLSAVPSSVQAQPEGKTDTGPTN